jgi:hypothetical protein
VGDDGLPLDRWANFYLITSAAAATLVGLLFVVITLAAERAQAKETSKIRLYLTPTVVYFGSVLCLAAVLTFPTQSRLSTAVCCSVAGTAGIAYALSTFLGSRGETRFYEPRDVIHYVLLPAAAYGLLIAGGAILIRTPQRGLTLVATGMLVLIWLGLRNSWAIAVGVVSWRRSEKDSEKDADR